MADAAQQLQQAYNLIESGDLHSARQLLDDIQSQNENNPDYWWIYTHAAEDAETGRNALTKVGQLAPNYPGLADLSRELGIEPPQPIPPQSIPTDTAKPPPLPIKDEFDITEDEFESFDDDTENIPADSNGNNLTPILLGVVLVAVAIISILFLLNVLSDDTDPIPTDVAGQATEAPVLVTADPQSLVTDEADSIETEDTAETEVIEETTETEEADDTDVESVPSDTVEPTEEPSATPQPTATDEPQTQDPFESVSDDLATFGVPADEGVTIDTTEAFGDTYIVTTCSALGPIATQNILGIINALTPNADAFADAGVEGVAFEITDCDAENVRLTLGIDSETLASYWAGDTSVAELQSALRRLN